MSTTHYVLGFLFRNNSTEPRILTKQTEVALIRKSKPDYQRGLLNGVGGKIEPNEVPLHAMRREFLEETGVNVQSWEKYAELIFQGGSVAVFRSFEQLTPTDKFRHPVEGIPEDMQEPVSWHFWPAPDYGHPILENLLWLVPLAFDRDNSMVTQIMK